MGCVCHCYKCFFLFPHTMHVSSVCTLTVLFLSNNETPIINAWLYMYCYWQVANLYKHLTWYNTNCLTINRKDDLWFDGGSKRVIGYEICILVETKKLCMIICRILKYHILYKTFIFAQSGKNAPYYRLEVTQRVFFCS